MKKSSALLNGLSVLSLGIAALSVVMVLLRRSQFWLAMAMKSIVVGFAFVAGKKGVDRLGGWIERRQTEFDKLK